MPIATTLRLLAIARGLSSGDIASAIPRAGAATVAAWMRGEKLPGRDQLDALARTFGVPVGALLAELASTLDPSRSKGEHALLAAYRPLTARQQDALLEVARSMATVTRSMAAVTPAIDDAPSPAAAPTRKAAATPAKKPAARMRRTPAGRA